MKIGILTFHCAHNYGAVLQTYALQEYIKGLGHEVSIINYQPEYLKRPYSIFNIQRIRSSNIITIIQLILREASILPVRIKRFLNFERFISSKLLLTRVVKREDIPSSFDAYIVGSDQVWNPVITRGFDDVYFCRFSFLKQNRRFISYAASMGISDVDCNQIRYLKIMLANFDFISVREYNLKNTLTRLVDKPIIQVLDPTLLVSDTIWDKISTKVKTDDKVVVVYQVRKNEKTLEIARHIAKQINARIINLVAHPSYNDMSTNQTDSPEKFIQSIRNASCVVTTSFHGTAFSIIFNKPFYTIRLNDGQDYRSESLLRALNLEDRLIDIDEIPNFEGVDYNCANQNLELLRKQSASFLINALSIS